MIYKFELFLVIQKKKKLININSFKLSLPLILYIELDILLGFLWFIYTILLATSCIYMHILKDIQ